MMPAEAKPIPSETPPERPRSKAAKPQRPAASKPSVETRADTSRSGPSERPRCAAPPEAPRSVKSESRREPEQRTGAPRGFADNVPAFLRRPLPKRQKVTSD